VEIDEAKFGKRKYNRGHRVDGVWVLGMVERVPSRKIVLIAVDKRDKETLHSLIEQNVLPDSNINTDEFKSYNGLNNKFLSHNTVNHTYNYVNPNNGAHTNTIEGNWYGIKVNVPLRGRTKTKINLYLTRFMILRNESGNRLENLLKYL
jgi:transposase-like protein